MNTKAKTRKPGQPMSDEQLWGLNTRTLVGNTRKFIRTDFGGSKEPWAVALDRAKEADPVVLVYVLAKLTTAEQKVIGIALVNSAVHACEGSRKRIQRYTDEISRRLDTTTV